MPACMMMHSRQPWEPALNRKEHGEGLQYGCGSKFEGQGCFSRFFEPRSYWQLHPLGWALAKSTPPIPAGAAAGREAQAWTAGRCLEISLKTKWQGKDQLRRNALSDSVWLIELWLDYMAISSGDSKA